MSWNKFKELLRKQFYPVGFLEERWYKWYGLRQRVNQTVQEYTTEFQQQAMVLNIMTEEYSVFIKYMAGLSDYIRKEMKLFTVESITEVSVKAIALEGKQKKGNEAKGDSKQTGGESSGSKYKEEKKGDPGKAELICSHFEKIGHVADRC